MDYTIENEYLNGLMHTVITSISSPPFSSASTFSFRLFPPLYLQFSPARQALTMIFILYRVNLDFTVDYIPFIIPCMTNVKCAGSRQLISDVPETDD